MTTWCTPKLFELSKECQKHNLKRVPSATTIMSLPVQNHWFYLGAAVVGIVSAAGIFIVEHLRQERKRHAMSQDLARLDEQLSTMRHEVEQLRQLQKEKGAVRHRRVPKSKAVSTTQSVISEDYTSAIEADSSDLEFYDLSEDENSEKTATPLDIVLAEVDERLRSENVSDLNEVLLQLTDLGFEYPENTELLWRIGKAHKCLSDISDDIAAKQDHISRGMEACESALRLKNDLADVHKWYGILVGCRSEFRPLKEKIADGNLFKKHVDIAISINPNDPTLHNLLGVFAYRVANLKWYERKVAGALSDEPLDFTAKDALGHFMNAERLSERDSENKVWIAKCKMALGEYLEAVDWLKRAQLIEDSHDSDAKVTKEIETLLAKCNGYSK